MEKIVSFTVKVPVSVHKKLKLIALLSEKSMTDVLIDWVNRTTNVIPDILVKPSNPVKPGKPHNPVTPVKPKMIVRKKHTQAVIDEINKTLLKYDRDGLSLQQITNKMIELGLPTVSGRGKWQKGSVDRQLKKLKGGNKPIA
jgi:hypothetical protein